MKLKTKKIRVKACKHCKKKFQPTRPIQPGCSYKCELALATAHADKKANDRDYQDKKKINQEARDARKATKEYRDNDNSHQTKLTQDVFNQWVRMVRDELEGCISCDTPDFEGGYGGAWDCGHFLSRGSCPELKFVSLNAYKQCKKCNGGSGKFGKFHNKSETVAQEYERRLILKIGQDKVDWLRGPHESAKHTCDQLREIRAFYAKLIRENNKDDSNCPHVERYKNVK